MTDMVFSLFQITSRVSAQRVALSKAPQDADPQHPVEVLRKRRKRPRRRAAEECDELAPSSPQPGDRTLPSLKALKKPCCASQHFGPSDFRNGSKMRTQS
jgi:hypothetical protein